jgi:hypothetical protein
MELEGESGGGNIIRSTELLSHWSAAGSALAWPCRRNARGSGQLKISSANLYYLIGHMRLLIAACPHLHSSARSTVLYGTIQYQS